MASKRRPYLGGKASLVDFFNAPVRHLKDLTTVESAFEKPYLDDQYRKMHFDMPWPDWPEDPSWPHWPVYPGSPVVPFDPMDPSVDPSGPVPGSSACAIVCYEPLDCDEPIWCHPGIWCGDDLRCLTCTWAVEGDVLSWGITAHPLGWGIDVWIDDSLLEGEKALVTVCMTDPCDNTCCKRMEITCKVCPPEVEISWDSDLSPGTIAANSSVSVYVKDGVGPYAWNVTGTGFSMTHATTEGVTNVLIGDANACGIATITVTDFCEGVTVGYVRSSSNSEWVVVDWLNLLYPGCPIYSTEGCSGNFDWLKEGVLFWKCTNAPYYNTTDNDCFGLSWPGSTTQGYCSLPTLTPYTAVYPNTTPPADRACFCTILGCKEWRCSPP